MWVVDLVLPMVAHLALGNVDAVLPEVQLVMVEIHPILEFLVLLTGLLQLEEVEAVALLLVVLV